MTDNQITSDDPLGDTDVILTQEPISRSDDVLEMAPSKKLSSSNLKTADKLFLPDVGILREDAQAIKDKFNVSVSLEEVAKVYTKYLFNGANYIIIKSWKHFVDVLSGYSNINQLIMSGHGSPGGMKYNDDDKNLNLIPDLFTKEKKKPPTINKRISLEGCDIALEPLPLVTFGQFFKAPEITAWTYLSHSICIPIVVTKDTTREKLEKDLKPYKPFLVKSTPNIDELLKTTRRIILLAQWFRYDSNPTIPDPTLLGHNVYLREPLPVKRAKIDELEQVQREIADQFVYLIIQL